MRDPGIAQLYLLLTFLLVISAGAERASAEWRKVWSEDFETRSNPGLSLETFGPADRLILASGGPNKCTGYMLKGESRSPAPGNGFCAASPSFDELGLNPAHPYTISFQYMVPDQCFCWTYALATRDACLVVSECDGTGSRARIGVVDHLHQNFHPLGTLTVGQWHEINVRIGPVEDNGERFVEVSVDGVMRGIQVRSQPSEYDRILFMDLPTRISDVNTPNATGPACFGSGNWDDIQVWAGQNHPRPHDKALPNIRVAPSPFNPSTQVTFDMHGAGLLHVDIFDLSGRHVRNLFGGRHPSGSVQLTWRGRDDGGRDVASGVYLIRVATPLGVKTDRAVLVR
jgi:hypothetical protein